MKHGMTFHSDEEWWAEDERRMRRAERLDRALKRTILLSAIAAVMFTVMWLCVRHLGAGHYNAWHEAIHSVRSQSR